MQQRPSFDQVMQLVNNGRLIEAEKILDQIDETDSLHYMVCFQRGYIRQLQGRMSDAKKLFFKSLSINSNFQQARRCLENLNTIVASIESFAAESDALYAYWFNEINNWGDILNKTLIEKLSGKKVIWVVPFDYRVSLKYIAIGSMVGNIDANTIVWGTGAMSEKHVPPVAPKKICAVRGPLTRQMLMGRGIDCPEIYGDPALLYPRFYNPVMEKKYDIGVIAHYVDKHHPWLKYANSIGAKIIDIQGGVEQVIDNIKSCSRIASSSLHGIIAADAYGVPSVWIEFSDGVIGDGFKFRDYYQSIHRPVIKPIQINIETRIDQLDEGFNVDGIDIDLELLLNSCPFLSSD